MSKIFISYASADRRIAEVFARELTAQSFAVWWDERIEPGLRFDREIERELKGASIVIVLWSSSSLASEWVSNEATTALKRNTLFPVLMDGVDLPLEFLRRQAMRIATHSEEMLFEGIRRVVAAIIELGRRRESVIGEKPLLDWRYDGGFNQDDSLLDLLPEIRPAGVTRYEVCREALAELKSRQGEIEFNFRIRAEDVFKLFTTIAGQSDLPDQKDAETALLLAHQLVEQYGELGRSLHIRSVEKKIAPTSIPTHFNRVYLNTVNTFVKDILNILPKRDISKRFGLIAHETDVAAALKHIVKVARVEPRRTSTKKLAVGPETHAIYTLGRLRANLPFMAVQDMLAKFEGKIDLQLADQPHQEDDFARQLRLMRRTVLLSRATLGDRESLKRYMSIVQNSIFETDINAGFHLEYYGDQTRDEQIPLCSRDDGFDCQRTLHHLTSSLTRALVTGLSRKSNPLYIIETYTLASIVARRIHGQYDEIARQSLSIVEKLHSRIDDEDMKLFLELLLDVASSGPEFPDREYGRFMAAKNAPRNGWVVRNVQFPETVGAHTTSLLWLCRRLPKLEYPKLNISRIRRMLEVHDLAEGVTSDIVATAPRDQVEKIERALMRRFSWLGLYMDPRVDLFDTYSLYSEFAAHQTPEAKEGLKNAYPVRTSQFC